ncbi:glutaredoxin [Thermosipho melanesiensis]|uniref:Glutaredoxin-like protein, YruB-family n=2 Tax=Thermosipho melanesiensis TaxID=46541 RepID=A6LKG8_THEM4|nr:glutaredoxin family protein [Thermosipho melanesiensis]ABR30419.1 glutaredoxin-like protein, YruB-family [Thermosipho melanesiensis BI429]APT73579.1 glutaredoxin [Thermosipho melanesiensis]OOC37527.1 glutaredoxin [Thermosipho melanesiensis]OOC39423.1 glutaredoxin [Thermosipho melanesiensis]OOC39486.1 glutaredoxin [Thermosipho melanesiensis]
MQHVKIVIYTTPTCPYCRKAKQYFKQLGFKFKEYDVSKDQKAAERMYKKSKQLGVPVIEIGNQVIVGFDKAKIDRLLNVN